MVVTLHLHMRLGWLFYAVVFVFCAGAWTQVAAADFNRNVRPILADNCFDCHGPDKAAREGDLRLDTRKGIMATLGGRPMVEKLIELVTSKDPDLRMPPPDALRQPSKSQIETLKLWVAEGAVYEEHWAFVAPRRRALPKVSDLDWCRNGIDRFVRSKLDNKRWTPRPEASRETLIRRLSLDLRGLPPTPAEVDHFVADESAGAFESLVDRLLDSPRYGEHMAWAWMEAARYSDTDGFQSDAERQMWRWRDWVIEAFNRNLPFDQFTIEQLAGDLLPQPSMDQILATGFNRNHRYDKGSGTIQSESIFENAADRMETMATVWLGLTVGCARCHDHKFDPISSREYYELLAFFDNVPENGQAILFNSHPRMKTPTREQQERLAKLDRKVRAVERELEDQESAIATAQREWERGIGPGFAAKDVVKRGLVDVFHLDGLEAKGQEKGGRAEFVPGIKGRAMAFAGRSYYEFDRSVGNLWGRNEFSLSFWFKLNSLADGVLMSELNDPDDKRTGTLIEIVDGRLRFMLSARWNYAVTWFEMEEKLARDKWYHFAVSCDGRVQLLAYHVYLNGTEAPIRVIQDSALDGKKNNDPWILGYSTLWPSFKGAIDELRFYNRELSRMEVGVLSVKESLLQVARRAEKQRTEKQRDLLRQYFVEHVAHGTLAEARSKLMAAAQERDVFLKSVPTTMVMLEGGDMATHFRVKGQFDQLGEQVEPGTPKVLPPFPPDLARNRLGFARWLTDRRNPLTARVAVNRVWQQLFGIGFVDSPENFGTQSARPVQAELLDWLATEFVGLDWDQKALMRLIVTSSTYRQASGVAAEMWEADPQNRYLARGPRHRLSAAVIRDVALAVGGLLTPELGGKSVYPYQPEGLWSLTSNKPYEPSVGKDLYRRSLYTFWRRAMAPPTMFLLDAPDREFCNVGVKRTNTPLQALATLNETGFFEAARMFGERMIRAGESDGECLAFGFRCVASRPATERELQVLLDSLREYRRGFAAGTTDLLAVGEMKPSGDIERAELAAFAAVANVLLNLDKTLTKE